LLCRLWQGSGLRLGQLLRRRRLMAGAPSQYSVETKTDDPRYRGGDQKT
jgi:hypothetical protein